MDANMLSAYVELSRPKHWVKNLFALLPVPFALASGASLDILVLAKGLLGFCLAASAVYAINDAQDAERDKAHETKRERPVASGRVSVGGARIWAAGLFALALALGYSTGSIGAVAIIALYVAINLVYSLGGKHIPLVDVFLLSSYYLLRVLLGCALVNVEPSSWLLLCTFALALFVSVAKRRADVIKGLDGSHRPSLLGYNQAFLDHSMSIMAGMTIVSYALYSMQTEVLHEGREFAALPFVIFIVLDYLRIVHVKRSGGSPVDLLLGSPQLIAACCAWLIATLWSLRLI